MSSSINHRRGGRRRRSPLAGVAAATLLLSALVGVATAPMTLASDVTIPSSFFTVSDQQGANDVPAQSDLTRMGRDDTDAAAYKLLWSWDSTDQWTGNGQTGDACALFNLDGDAGGKVDAVLCGQVTNPGADTTKVVQNHAPYVFRCDNSKVDRCGQPSAAIPYSGSQLQSGALGDVQALASTAAQQTQNLINDTDPFPSGSNYPNDAMLQVNIAKSYLSGTVAASQGNKWPAIASPTPVLTNVCSYPSAGNGGNNNPFDCIVNPGTGFLNIVKNAASDLNWSFGVTGVPTGAATTYAVATSGGTGTSATIPMGGGTNKSVTETAKDGWSLTAAACSYPSGSTTTATGSRSGLAISSITVNVGVLTTCTFTNTRNTGAIVVTKVDGAGTALGGAAFSVKLDGTTGSGTAMTDNGSGVFCIDGLPTGGTYDITETTTPTGYTGDSSIADVTVGATATTCALRLAATPVVVDRQVTNTRDLGAIVVKKVDGAGAALTGAAFSVKLDGTAGSGTAMTDNGSGVFCIDGLPTGGTYDITETTTPTGYTGDSAIADVTVSMTATTCALRLAATLVVVDRQVTNTRNLGSIVIHKEDANGEALDGAAFTATLGDDDPLSFADNGEGVFCLDGLPTGGTYAIEETTVPAGYSQTTTPDDVTVEATSTCTGRLADEEDLPDLTITNSPVNADLTIDKTDDRGVALEGAEFSLYADTDKDGTLSTTEDDAAALDVQVTDEDGSAVFENVAPGFYCIVETGTPTGYSTAATQCFEVGLGSEAGQGDDQTIEFENVRTHRVVVLVCHEGTDTLEPSDVTVGSETKTSLAAGTLTAGQQKALCDLGGASFGGIEHSSTPVAVSVSIGGHTP